MWWRWILLCINLVFTITITVEAATPIAEYRFEQSYLDSSTSDFHATNQGATIGTGKVCNGAIFGSLAYGSGTNTELTRNAWVTTSGAPTSTTTGWPGVPSPPWDSQPIIDRTTQSWNGGYWGQWVQVDLGGNYWLSRIELYGNQIWPESFTVSISEDGTNWTTIKSDNYHTDDSLIYKNTLGNFGASYDVASGTLNTSLKARFVRYRGDDYPAGINWSYLLEMVVWGHPASTSTYVLDNNNLDLTNSYTLSAWIKTSKASGTIISKTDNSSPYNGYVFAVGPDSGGKLSLWSSGSWNTSTGTPINDGNWHHVTAVVSGTSLQFYVDGTADGGALTINATTASSTPLKIGLENNPYVGLTRYFSGSIDEVLIFNTPLTPTEIASIYTNQSANRSWNNSPSACSGDKIAEYHFENTFADSSGNGLNGSSQGPIIGSGKVCHGTEIYNQQIQVADDPLLRFTNAYTLSAWIRTSKAEGTIIKKYQYPGDVKGYGLSLTAASLGGGGKLMFWKGSGNWHINSSGKVVNDGVWHHVGAVINGTSLQFYVDGQPDGAAINMATTTTNSTEPLVIGRSGYDGFEGQIDEVVMFNYALSAAEMLAGYNNQKSGKYWDGSASACSADSSVAWLYDSSGYKLNYNGTIVNATVTTAGGIYEAGNAYYQPSSSYGGLNPTNIFKLQGGNVTITFDRPVADPHIAIFSLGTPWSAATYTFPQPPTMIASGPNNWLLANPSYPYSCAISGNVLTGLECNGIFKFKGIFTSLSFSTSNENWHGFNVGITGVGTAATLLSEYHFEDKPTWNGTASELKDSSGNNRHGKAINGLPAPTQGTTDPAIPNAGTCGYAILPGPQHNGKMFEIAGLPVNTTAGAQTSVSFWVYWDADLDGRVIGWSVYDLMFYAGHFGFNTGNDDIYGVTISGLYNVQDPGLRKGWHHVVAIFTNGDVTQNQLYIDGVARNLSQRRGTPIGGINSQVSSTMRVGGRVNETTYTFTGRVDEVKVYNGALTVDQVTALYTEKHTCPSDAAAALLGEYRFEEQLWTGVAGELKDSSGNGRDGQAIGSPLPTPGVTNPAKAGSVGTCGYANLPGPYTNGGAFDVPNLPVNTSSGAKTSVSFWMYWDGLTSYNINDFRILMGWDRYDVALVSGILGFNTSVGDMFGVSVANLAQGWHHITAVFVNNNVQASKLYIDGSLQTLTQQPGYYGDYRFDNSYAVVKDTLRIGGWQASHQPTQYRFSGRLDEVRVYNGELSQTEITSIYNSTHACSNPPTATLLAEYHFEDTEWTGAVGELKDSSGNARHGAAGGSPLPTPTATSPAIPGGSGTCGYASLPGPYDNGGRFSINNLPISTTAGAQTTVSFWMYWNGSNSAMPIGWTAHDLWLVSGSFGFNTGNGDFFGISSTGLANSWHHVIAVFTNGQVSQNRLYIDGEPKQLTQISPTWPASGNATVASTLNIGGWGANTGYRFAGRIDELKVFNGAVTAEQVKNLYAERHNCLSNGGPVAEYHFEDLPWNGTANELVDSSGNNRHGTFVGSSPALAATVAPALAGTTGTCGYADIQGTAAGPSSVGGVFTTNLPLAQNIGDKNTVSFWMYWEGGVSGVPIRFANRALFIGLGFGFNSGDCEVYGVSDASLVNGWHHVVAVSVNGDHTKNKLYIDGALQTLSYFRCGPAPTPYPYTPSTLVNIGGSAQNAYIFKGKLDEVKFFDRELTQSEITALHNETHQCYAKPIAEYHFEEPSGWNGTAGELKDSSGNNLNGTASSATAFSVGSASPAKAGTCNYLELNASGGGAGATGGKFTVNNLPVNTAIGAKNSASFWMYYSGGFGVMPLDFGGVYDLEMAGWIGFNSYQNNVYGYAAGSSLTNNGWHHVVAVFNNGDASKNKIYINGTSQPLGVIQNSIPVTSVTSTLYIGGSKYGGYNFGSRMDELKIFDKELTPSEVAALYNETHSCSNTIHHLRLEHAGSGVTCTGSKISIWACSGNDNLDGCEPNTSGISGNLVAQSPDGTVLSSTPFVIPAGASMTNVILPVTSAQTAVLSTTDLSSVTSTTTSCWVGNNADCRHTFYDTGFLFTINDHIAETTQNFTVSAVKKADNSLACVPAFSNVNKSVNFKCSYLNPITGTLPVRVAGTALNFSNNANAACDNLGNSVNLAFGNTGIANTSLLYADVGKIKLTATYIASGNDGGLTMTGNNEFIAAPKDFAVIINSTPPIKAGNNFSASVQARNQLGNLTPNFNKEITAETVDITFSKTEPTGSTSQNGSPTGTVGSFSNGVATGTAFQWSEVGKLQLTASLHSGNYLGSGINPTSGSAIAGPFIPDHFNTSITHGCNTAEFTYSGQPFALKVTALNAQNNRTYNYDGTANTTPNHGKAVTLSEPNGIAGSFASTNVAASSFVEGEANVSPTYTFTTRQTIPSTIKLRTNNGDGVSSAIGTEATTNIYSGRARLYNANGATTLPLPTDLHLEYWNGTRWAINTIDTCTSFSTSNFTFNFTAGTASTPNNFAACESNVSINSNPPNSLAKSKITLSAPGLNNYGWTDMTLNLSNAALGAGYNKCINVGGAGGAETAASKAWLQFPWKAGNNNPTARMTFGTGKSSKIIHMREVH